MIKMNYCLPLEFVLTWSEANIIKGVLNFLNIRISQCWTLQEKPDSMLKMLLLNAIIALYCTNTETFLHQQPRSLYVSRCRAVVMALPPTDESHRIPIGFLFSHLNRITNDTRPGNSNNWCLSVVWLTSLDADQLHTRIQVATSFSCVKFQVYNYRSENENIAERIWKIMLS